MPTLWTIGYERLTPEALASELRAAGVRRVLDVRIRPQSRRPGMSKTKLGTLLAANGIVYESRRELGTPPDIKPFYKRGAVREAARLFRAHLESAAKDDLAALAAELADPATPSTALLCLEAEPRHCHRSVVAELLAEKVPGLVIVDL